MTTISRSDLAGMTPEECRALTPEPLTMSKADAELIETAKIPRMTPVARDALPMEDIIRLAVEKGTPAAELERLVALAERMADRAALAALNSALAEFRRKCPVIVKNRKNFQARDDGTDRKVMFADLTRIVETIGPTLAECGLSFSFNPTFTADAVTNVCTVRHALGGTLTSQATVPLKVQGGMSPQQAYGSAMAYSQRYALVGALGLTSADEDTDGAEPELRSEAGDALTDDERMELEAAFHEVGGDILIFSRLAGGPSCERIGDIPRSRLARAHDLIAQKKASIKVAK